MEETNLKLVPVLVDRSSRRNRHSSVVEQDVEMVHLTARFRPR